MPLVPKCTIVQECVISMVRGLQTQKLSEAKLPCPPSGGVPSCGSYPRLFDSDGQLQKRKGTISALNRLFPGHLIFALEIIVRINKAFCRGIYENGTLEFQILRGVRMDLWGLPSA